MKKKIIATASLGGHWKQLLRITQPLEDRYDVVYASTYPKCGTTTGGKSYYMIQDFNRKNAWRLLPAMFRVYRILRREHPDAVITTGAAPGLVFVMVAWLLHYKTIWVDSIANVARLSASGRIARRFASRVYTQWPNLAQENVIYAGTIYS